jgi:hypothetical protein
MLLPQGPGTSAWCYRETDERRSNEVGMIMGSTDDGEFTFAVESKTGDGLRFRLVRTITENGRNGYVQFKKEDVARVMSEFGSTDPDFVFPFLHRIGKLGIKEKIWDPEIIKFAISFIRGIRPRDEISALLGLNMMTVHQTILVNYGRIIQARVMQYDEEEEDAQRAVNRLVRAFIRLVDEFDRRQNRGEQKLAVANGHQLANTSKRAKRSADPATGIVDQSDIGRIHRAAISNAREGDQVRSMGPIEDRESTGETVDIKTSDGLKFKTLRTSYDAYLNVDEQDAVRVMAKYGSSDPDFGIPLILQITKLGIKGRDLDPDIIKLALSFVRSIRPRDEIGALLGYHMAVVNEALSFNFSRVNQAQFMQYNVEEENADRAVNWSARTFMALEEAFERHQNGSEQKHTIRHVAAANGHRFAKTSKRPKRGIKNENTLMNGAANAMERHGEVLLRKNQDGE